VACLYVRSAYLPNDPKFIDMIYIIHSDEKWFNASKKRETYYLLPDEEDPHRTVQNKKSIAKVMVYSGVGMPMFDAAGNCTFDGKLGVWPFVRKLFIIIRINSLIVCVSIGNRDRSD